jgi:hypothetical protein
METNIIAPYFATLAVFAVAINLFYGWLNTWLLKLEDKYARWGTYASGVILGAAANYLHLGMFADMTIGWSLVYGFAGALLSNGTFKLEFIESFLVLLRAKSAGKKVQS